MVKLPFAISSSAARLDISPQSEIYFCKRILSMVIFPYFD